MISDRSIATVLFTDIVGSTDKAAALGDRRWREVLHQHHVLVREQLGRFGGKEIVTTGDGFLAVFDDPARAIVCAAAVRDRVAEIGLQVRCGVHMGQVERSHGDVSGIAVHIGARVAAHARPGEVLVSATVRETERGSDFEFEDRGGHELKGVPGELRLYALAGVPDDLVEYYDIGGVPVELDQTLATSVDTAPVVVRDAIWQRRLPWALASVGLVAVSAVGVGIWMIRGSGGDSLPSVTRTTVTLAADQQLDTQHRAMPLALSPDGRRLVYVAHSAGRAELYLRNLDAFETKPMAGTEGARYPFFSPDGQWVAFFAEDKLKRVSIQGGSPVTVCNTPVAGRGGTWGPDGTIVFDPGISGLMRVAADGGIPEPVVSQDAEMDARNLRWPQFLPHGRALLATATIEGNATLVVLSLDTGTWRQLGRGSQAQYVPPGHLVFHSTAVKEGELQAVGFDVERLTIRGEPISVLDGVFRSNNGGGAYFAVAGSGTLVFARGGHARTLVRVDRNGRRVPLVDDRRGFRLPRISPDGRRVAVTIDPRPSQIWIYDIERGSGLPLATEGHNLASAWTPDSRRVAYTSDGEMYWRAADASSEAQRLLARDRPQYPSEWSRDGRSLIFLDDHPTNRFDIWVMTLDADPRPLVATGAHELMVRLSPDERWLAYVSDESGRYEVYVRPFPNVDERKWTISTGGGVEPVWSTTGRELFYMNGMAMMAVAIEVRGATLDVAAPELLFTGPFETGSPSFDISPDGTYFVMVEADPDAKPTQIQVVLNWAGELNRLVTSSR